MTTAMPPSARPGIRRGGPLEQGEDRLQLQTEVLDRLGRQGAPGRSEEHTSELQSQSNLVCRLLLEKKKKKKSEKRSKLVNKRREAMPGVVLRLAQEMCVIE